MDERPPRCGTGEAAGAAHSRRLVSLVLLATACSRPGDPTPPPLDPREVRAGRVVYAQRCAGCHGARGQGAPDWKRPMANGELPPPPHDSSGHTWHHADGLLYRIILRGGAGAAEGAPVSWPSGMPAFADSLTAAEIRAVITFLKTGWTPRQRLFQAEISARDPLP